jgi:hypothetical protein
LRCCRVFTSSRFSLTSLSFSCSLLREAKSRASVAAAAAAISQ